MDPNDTSKNTTDVPEEIKKKATKRIIKIKKKTETDDATKKVEEAGAKEKKPRAPRKKKDATETAAKNELIKAPPAKEEEEDCPICVEHYTPFLRRKITCPYCKESTCMACVKRYIVSTPNDPHCAHCQKGWTTSFLYDNLTRAYMIGDYANHRAAILWSQQESLLPTEQICAERVLRGREMQQKSIAEGISKKIADLYREIDALQRQKDLETNDIQRLLRGEASVSDIRAAGGQAELDKKVRAEAREFVRRCPHTDCTGFLSSAWKCGICSNYTCNECLEVKGKERDAAHTCNADSLATAKLLAKDTKPCPKCGVYINKGVGCDLMWCTSCQTPFSWSTLKIAEGRNIHNPHYFEFLQRTRGAVPRTPGDLICGGIPEAYYIVRNIVVNQYKMIISNILRQLGHIQDIELRRYHTQMQQNDTDMKWLRIRFLLKEETKESIQNKLQLWERQRERAHAIHTILETVVAVGGDITRPMQTELPKMTNNYKEQETYLKDIIRQCEELRLYINEELMKVSKAYYCSVPNVSTEWSTIISTRKPTEPRKKKDDSAPDVAALPTISQEETDKINYGKESTIFNGYITDINSEKNLDTKVARISAFMETIKDFKQLQKTEPYIIIYKLKSVVSQFPTHNDLQQKYNDITTLIENKQSQQEYIETAVKYLEDCNTSGRLVNPSNINYKCIYELLFYINLHNQLSINKELYNRTFNILNRIDILNILNYNTYYRDLNRNTLQKLRTMKIE